MKRVLKWIAIGAGTLLGLIVLVLIGMYTFGSSKVDRTYAVETAELAIPTDAASVAHGAHLARIHGCVDCHTNNLSGQVFLDIPPFRATAANLTRGRGGVGGRYTAEDFDRAIRHGVKPNGRPVIIMPSAAFHQMSDADAAALIAYLQQLPPVDKELPPTEIRAPGRVMAAALFDPAMEVRTGRARAGAAPPVAPTAEYGSYLASITCAYCHGTNLRGNTKPPIQGSPPAPNLVARAHGWSLPQFKQTLRTGMTPDGRRLDPEYMPFSLTAAMNDAELEALYAYLRAQ